MTYQPIVPLAGFAGWKFLERTMETQQAAFSASAQVQSDEAYFRENISNIESPEDLVKDYRLLKVSLAAFGLEDDIGSKFFIQKVLEEGTIEDDSLANKLSDKRYFELSEAFGFDFTPPNTVLSSFSDDIIAKYEERSFETAIGEVDSSMRIALNLQRELPDLAAEESSERTKWFSIIGNEAMATAVRTGLGLPASVSSLDVDQQVEAYAQKAEAVFGSSDPAQFTDSEKVDKLIKYYLLREQIESGGYSSTTKGATALTLLQNMGNSSSFSALF
ncbi:flagellar protein [Thioclava sp. SK-1]|uniref:DUF1217 domain-containing protein n=1 Tax=Thioclava sp. SK-1 TaxID=1889770 RepID=UPI00082419FE|nr:DUF1217 domain-containing protein [Thioclava sp. SK-1]OCX63396.1 flagellar protein [Thioclava sp. SK-1]